MRIDAGDNFVSGSDSPEEVKERSAEAARLGWDWIGQAVIRRSVKIPKPESHQRQGSEAIVQRIRALAIVWVRRDRFQIGYWFAQDKAGGDRALGGYALDDLEIVRAPSLDKLERRAVRNVLNMPYNGFLFAPVLIYTIQQAIDFADDVLADKVR